MTGWGSGGINLTPDETNLTVEIPEIEVQGAVVESFVELLIELNTAPAIGIGGAQDFVQLLFFCEFVGEPAGVSGGKAVDFTGWEGKMYLHAPEMQSGNLGLRLLKKDDIIEEM